MLSTKALKGKAIQCTAKGTVLGTVIDVYFDAQQQRLAALHVRRPGLLSNRSVVYWQDVLFSDTDDGLAVPSAGRLSALGEIAAHWRTPFTSTGRWRVQVGDGDGNLLGWCADVLVFGETGRIGACIVSYGVWRDFVWGARLLNAAFTIDPADPALFLNVGKKQSVRRDEIMSLRAP